MYEELKPCRQPFSSRPRPVFVERIHEWNFVWVSNKEGQYHTVMVCQHQQREEIRGVKKEILEAVFEVSYVCGGTQMNINTVNIE